jgi:hypothetical protein
MADLPEYLSRWPGLFTWREGKVVDAPPEDVDVARRYPTFSDKGPVVSGMRLTIMSARTHYRIGDDVRVLHVVEVVEPGKEVFVMGPKAVYGEFVDDQAVTPAPPDGLLQPTTYNGPTLDSPAVDYNYEVTSYRFTEPGQHSIQWRLGDLRSNTLLVDVTP